MEDGAEPTYVMLPPEHPDYAKGLCGLLLKHMYGTRAAANGWQLSFSGCMGSIWLVQGEAGPCIFTHPSRGIVCSVHGDDFTTSAGEKRELDWLESMWRLNTSFGKENGWVPAMAMRRKVRSSTAY